MESSKKSNSHLLAERVGATLAPLIPVGSRILTGLSGGVDSVVLLHLLHDLAPRFSWKISALHVHHGISPHADTWADFCAALCQRYDIPLHIQHVDITPLLAQGIEAAARELRHAAFAAQSCDFVALAHHADDQVETLFLQLLRGAGVRGASAMPVLSPPGRHVARVRPLLHSTRCEILAYATAQNLAWIEDESNADDNYPRNYLRHQLLPQLAKKFPAYRQTLSRSTRHFAEAASLLDEVAEQDAASFIHEGTLTVSALQTLSPARAKNLLRFFLHQHSFPMPQVVQLEDMLQQLSAARQDARVCISFGGGNFELRRYQNRVYALRTPGKFDSRQVLSWQGETSLDWPALDSRVSFRHTCGEGLDLARLQASTVTLRQRQGGESLRPSKNSASRTLKNLLQEHSIPPWRRERLPLLYCGEDLVCVPGVAIAAEYQAAAGDAALSVTVDSTKMLL